MVNDVQMAHEIHCKLSLSGCTNEWCVDGSRDRVKFLSPIPRTPSCTMTPRVVRTMNMTRRHVSTRSTPELNSLRSVAVPNQRMEQGQSSTCVARRVKMKVRAWTNVLHSNNVHSNNTCGCVDVTGDISTL